MNDHGCSGLTTEPNDSPGPDSTPEAMIVKTLSELHDELLDRDFTVWQVMRLLTAAMPEITKHYLKGA